MIRLRCGARDSILSRAQVTELQQQTVAILEPVFYQTVGDRDQQTSLRTLDKTDFFTREIDQALLQGQIRIAVHSAKDLPEPLPQGLTLIALTTGVDPRDCLVIREGEDLSSIRLVATSSESREERVRSILPHVQFVDLRGTIQKRLDRLFCGAVDGVVVAEAALVRLKLRTLNRYFLPPPHTESQGQLAILARSGDHEMQEVFQAIDSRGKKRSWILYLGLDPPENARILHYPVLRTEPIPDAESQIRRAWAKTDLLLFTSKRAIAYLPRDLSWEKKRVFAIGRGTASFLPNGVECTLAQEATQEGMVELLKTHTARTDRFLWPRSSRSRSFLLDYLTDRVEAIDLYETHPHQPGFPPSLEDVEELIFTSPSCVEGFFRIYDVDLVQKKLKVLGPITKARLLAVSGKYPDVYTDSGSYE